MINKRLFFFTIVVLMLVSLVFHFADFISAMPVQGKFHVTDPDSLLFLRYYEQSLLQGELIKYDTYGCFPQIKQNPFPPVHMSLLLNTAYLYFSIFPDSTIEPDYIIGWLPPLLGWLTMFLAVLFVWYQTRNPAMTLMVAFSTIPGLPAKMTFSFLRMDYHFLNSFFISAWLFFAWNFIRLKKSWNVLVGAIVSALFILTWHATPLFFGLVTVYAFYLWFCGSPLLNQFADYASSSMLIASGLGALYVYNADKTALIIADFGWFQIATVFIGGLFIKALNSFEQKIKFNFNLRVFCSFGVAVFGVLISFIFFYDQIYDGLGFLTAKDPVMAGINELQPFINFSKILGGPDNFFKGRYLFGLAFLTFPLVIMLNPSGIFSKGGVIFRDWYIIIAAFALFSLRFARWFGGLPALMTGITLYCLFKLVLIKLKQQNPFFKFKIVFAFLPIMISVFLIFYSYFFPDFRMNTDLIDALNWIRENTPVTSGYADKKPPEYGILANWGEGNKIAYYARRPVLVNNAHWGYKKMAEIFTARSEKEAAELCQKHKARYIYIEFRKISDDRIDFLDMYKKKENATYDVFSFTTDYVPPDPPVASYTDTFHYWLSDNLGILPTGDFESPSENFRIIYSSRQINRFTSPKVLLYEFVKGCEIHGIADPKTEVVISTGCRFDKVEQLYKRSVVTDKLGKFSIKVPYSSAYNNGRVKTDSSYKLRFIKEGKKKFATLSVDENQVINGDVLNIADKAEIQFEELSENQ